MSNCMCQNVTENFWKLYRNWREQNFILFLYKKKQKQIYWTTKEIPSIINIDFFFVIFLNIFNLTQFNHFNFQGVDYVSGKGREKYKKKK